MLLGSLFQISLAPAGRRVVVHTPRYSAHVSQKLTVYPIAGIYEARRQGIADGHPRWQPGVAAHRLQAIYGVGARRLGHQRRSAEHHTLSQGQPNTQQGFFPKRKPADRWPNLHKGHFRSQRRKRREPRQVAQPPERPAYVYAIDSRTSTATALAWWATVAGGDALEHVPIWR